MNRRFCLLLIVTTFVALLPFRSPAPLHYTPGEGWYYETIGLNTNWQRTRAKDQLEVAEQAFASHDYKIASHAAHRVVRIWPLSDYAPRAQYLVGRCLEADGKDEAAFNAYQNLIEKYPRSDNFQEILWRQYAIAGRFLNGEWFRLYDTIPLYSSMDETAKLFNKIVKNGPYSEVAPHAQLRIGAAHEKEKNYGEAVKAYATAADRYYDQPSIAADALYRQAVSYQKESATAEYDQSTAGRAIETYNDFMAIYPDDQRVSEAQKAIVLLKAEQVHGNFKIAQFYEKSRRWAGAIVYYNEVLQLDPNSIYAAQSRQRIEALKPRLQVAAN
jgi:outer membrane protein assembly factor BamD